MRLKQWFIKTIVESKSIRSWTCTLGLAIFSASCLDAAYVGKFTTITILGGLIASLILAFVAGCELHCLKNVLK